MKASRKSKEHQQEAGRILIVDDLLNWRETLSDLLQGDGHTVIAADGAAQALHLLNSHSVDVAILDLRLRDRDIYDVRGLHLVRQIRRISPRIRLVMITGFDTNRLLDRLPHVCDVDALWLKNPTDANFDIKLFRQEVRALVRESRNHGENAHVRVHPSCRR